MKMTTTERLFRLLLHLFMMFVAFFISMDTYTQYRSLPIYHQTTRATTRYVKAAKKAYDLNLNKSHWIERGD